MCTARSSGHPGGLHQAPLWDQTPHGAGTPSSRTKYPPDQTS